MHVRTGPETHPTTPTICKFSCTEVKRPGRDDGGGGHSSLSSVGVGNVLAVYFHIPTVPGEEWHRVTFIFNFKLFCI